MFMNSVIDLTAYLPEQPAPRRRKRKFGSIAAAVETAVTLLMGVGFLLALTAFLLALPDRDIPRSAASDHRNSPWMRRRPRRHG